MGSSSRLGTQKTDGSSDDSDLLDAPLPEPRRRRVTEVPTTAPARSNGLFYMLLATGIGGGAGYILTLWAGFRLGDVGYAPFAVFWSALFLVVGALSGLQQEISRATQPRTPYAGPIARNFTAAAALIVLAVAVASSPLWAPSVFPDDGFWLVLPLAFGIAMYVGVAVISGINYGLNLWRLIAAMVIVDGLMRLVLTGGLLFFTSDMRILAWAITAPYLLTPIVLFVFLRRFMLGRTELDVGYRQLSWNVLRTVVGAAATGVLVSGFPLLIGATSNGEPIESQLMFAINVTRAPVIIVVMALQSYFIVQFKSVGDELGRTVLKILGLIAGATIVVSALAAWIGPGLLGLLLRTNLSLDPWLLGGVVASGGMIGALCVTGPAAISRSRHLASTAGWVAAALVFVVILLLPLGLEARVLLAAFVGPAVGLVIHLISLLGSRRAADVESVPES